MKRFLSGTLIVAVASLVGGGPDRLQGQDAACGLPGSYTISELPGMGLVPEAFALNDLGQAAGKSLDASWQSRAIGWKDGRMVNISGTWSGAALGISSDGRVAGWRSSSSGTRGAVWTGSTVTSLAPLPGHLGSHAYDVNRSGVAVGSSTNSYGDPTAVMWRNGQATSLATGYSRPSSSYAFAINDAGQIVGRGNFASRPFGRALLWTGSAMRSLPDLGAGYAGAAAISGNGTIVGAALHSTTSKYHAAMWSASNQSIRDLGLLYGVHPTAAYGVNDCGMAVGDSVVDVATNRVVAVAFENGQVWDLHQLVPGAFEWNLITARAINNRGEIVGYGFRSGVGQRAFLLRPAS